MKPSLILDKIVKGSLYLLVVLLPLWFLPLTQNVVEYQKQALLVLLVFVGVISWLAKMVYEGELRFRTSWLHMFVGGLVGVFGVSTLFSLWQYGSFWGWPLHASDNFLVFLAFGLLYFFISQSVKDSKHLFFLLCGLLLSSTLAIFFALLQMKGIFVLPFEFTQVQSFNTIGTNRSVGLLAAILVPLAVVLGSIAKGAWKNVLLGVAILLFGALALFDFSVAWIAMIAGLIALLAFDLWFDRSSVKPGKSLLPMVFVLVALLFLFMGDFSIPGSPVKQLEVSPNVRGELATMQGIVSENPLVLLIGSGPGTFVFDYSKFRPVSLNQTVFWDTRFGNGKSEFLDWLVTKGAWGVIMLLGLFVAAGFFAQRKVRQKENPSHDVLFMSELSFKDHSKTGLPAGQAGKLSGEQDEEKEDYGTKGLSKGLLVALIASIMSLALYPANLVLWFVIWIFLGCLGFLVSRPRVISLSLSPSYISLGTSLVLVVFIIAAASLFFVGGQKYYAEIVYLKGVKASEQGNVEEAIVNIFQAARLNARMDVYWRDLAQLYVARANRIAADQSLPLDVRQQQTGMAVRDAVSAAKKATESNDKNVVNWNVQGFVYRSLIGTPGAESFAVASYERARELEPASPFPWTELGRVKILQVQQLAREGLLDQEAVEQERQRLLAEALDDLEQAVKLKPDYAPAHYLMAVVQDQQGNEVEAIAKLEETKQVAPGDIGLAFQLGVIYYQQDELEKALNEFERAKSLNLGYSNARYMLGLVYDRLNRRADAIAEFTAVTALNPDNQEVKDILANLTGGLPALQGIIPGEPPIQENPPEIEENE